MQTEREPLTWNMLIVAEPRLQQFERAAREAAANGWTQYTDWLPTFGTFQRAMESTAERLGVDSLDVQGCLLDRLATIHARTSRSMGAARTA